MRRRLILSLLVLGLLLTAGLMTACNTADPMQPVPVANVKANIIAGENGSLELQADPEEIVIDGETGLLVPPGAAERLADAIIELLTSSARRR